MFMKKSALESFLEQKYQAVSKRDFATFTVIAKQVTAKTINLHFLLFLST